MRLIAMAAACILSQFATAEYYERDNSYVYKITPKRELAASPEGLRFTAEMSERALVNVLTDMVDKQMLPQSVMNYDDIKKFSKVHEEIDNLIAYLNDFIKEQRAKQSTYFEFPNDIYPDAYLIFGGGKISINVGKGIGASGNIGLVVMPVQVQKYSLSTGKLVASYGSIRTAMVAMPTVDVGLGLGGGVRFRGGIGFIWDINHSFTNPEQFWGGGLGVSYNPPNAWVGVNGKAGVIANWESPQRNYFVMATAAIEVGPGAEVTTPRINAMTVLNGVTFLNLFNTSAEKVYKEQMRELAKQMDEVVRRLGPQLPKEDRGTDNDLDGEDDEPTPAPVKPGKPGKSGKTAEPVKPTEPGETSIKKKS